MGADLQPLAYSAAETAQVLRVSRPTVYQLMSKNDFPTFRIGNRVLVSADGLKSWISKQVEVNKVEA